MKNLFTFAIAFFFLLSLNAQQTYLTSGNSSDWSSPSAWKLESGEAATQAPDAEDHIIINDYLSLDLAQTYTHRGNISIMGNGLLQISTREESNSQFVFGGKEMNVYGYLISSANFSQVHAPNGKRGIIILHETATMNYAASFSLLGGLILEASACGATKIEKDLVLLNEDAFICGEGKIMVGANLRAFDNTGQEIRESEVKAFFAESSCEQIEFYNNLENCEDTQARIAGNSNPQDFLGVENMEVHEDGTGVSIVWESEAATMTQTFTVERSIDGFIFEAIATLDNVDKELFQVLDKQPVQVKSYYRIRQVLNSGQAVHSEVKVYDPGKDIFAETQVNFYPNNLVQGEKIHLETSRLKDVYSASLEVRTMNGQLISEERLPVSPNGKIYADIQMNMNPGMYLLVIRVGGEVITKKAQIR